MTIRFPSLPICASFAVLSLLALTSCTVDENASLIRGVSPAGDSSKEKKTSDKEASAKKEADAKAKVAAAKAKEESARKSAEAKAAAREKAEKLALAKKEAAEEEAREKAEEKKEADEKAAEAAEKKALEEALVAKEKTRAAEKEAKLAAKKKAEADRDAREATEEIEALATRSGGGGFFSMLSIGTSTKQYKSKGHEIFVNGALLPALNPSNAKIEISLSEQRARVYRKDGDVKVLVIETDISSGRPGYTTPTGTYSIGEKKVEKRSNLYGSGSGSNFVGAEMPYWMRINGGIGMHIGIVPGVPASHGCIRVPASVQPLIFSKVGVGTPVTISH